MPNKILHQDNMPGLKFYIAVVRRRLASAGIKAFA